MGMLGTQQESPPLENSRALGHGPSPVNVLFGALADLSLSVPQGLPL